MSLFPSFTNHKFQIVCYHQCIKGKGMYFTSASTFFESICDTVNIITNNTLLRIFSYASLILHCLFCSHIILEINLIDRKAPSQYYLDTLLSQIFAWVRSHLSSHKTIAQSLHSAVNSNNPPGAFSGHVQVVCHGPRRHLKDIVRSTVIKEYAAQCR